MRSLGILLSGRGSNFVAIADSIDAGRIPDARIGVVLSNKADAPGIETARQRGLNALVIPSKGKRREEHDQEIVAALKQHNVDLVCLAGYMRLLSPWFVQQFPRRILNIHPSLLPAFPGLGGAGAGFCLRGESIWLHRAFCGRRTGSWRHHCAEDCAQCSILTTSAHWLRAFWSRSTSRIQRRSTLCWAGSSRSLGED